MVTEKFIEEWIASHKEEMIEELKLWISQTSVSRADLYEKGAPFGPDCRKMLDLFLKRGKHYGFETEDHEGYCGAITYGNKEEEIGFIAHLDVVPEGNHWIYEPYKAVVKDGYVIGRGCGDNKGPGVLALFLMRFIKENNIELKHGLRLIGGCAEETGMADLKYYVDHKLGPIPVFSLVTDASFPVCYAQKGGFDAAFKIPCGKNLLSFTAGSVRNAVPDTAVAEVSGITLEDVIDLIGDREKISISGEDDHVIITGHGKAGHAAFQIHGEKNNAIVILSEALTVLERRSDIELYAPEFIKEAFSTAFGDGMSLNYVDEESGELTINAGVIHKEENHLILEIDIRYPVTDDSERIKKRLSHSIRKVGGELIVRSIAKPYYIDPKDAKVTALLDAFKEVTGIVAEPYAMGGGTYSRVFPDAITFGPGFFNRKKADFLPDGHGGGHGPDEALNIEDWLTAFKIYILSVLKLDTLL